MSDFAKLKVAEIKEAVLKLDPNFIDRDITGKSAWVEVAKEKGLTPEDISPIPQFEFVGTPIIKGFNDGDSQAFANALEEAELEEENVTETKVEEKSATGDIPKYTDVGWHEYVMSQFHESELDRGYPKVEGMRRLAEILLGEILFSGAIDCKSSMPSEGNDPGRSVVNYEIQILWKNGVEPYVYTAPGITPYTTRAFRGLASCYPGNVKGNVFVIFPESIAETRAEARALRKALGLKVVAAEEFGDVESEQKTSVSSEKIQDPQIFWINTKVEANNLNLPAILDEYGLEKLEDADRVTGADIIKKINELMKKDN